MWCEAGKYNTKKGRDHFLTKDITSIKTNEMSESLAFYQRTFFLFHDSFFSFLFFLTIIFTLEQNISYKS